MAVSRIEGSSQFLQVNVVVMRGVNDDEICDFVELTRDAPINVRFIEYMPFDGNVWSHQKMVSFGDMTQMILAKYPQGLEPLKVAYIVLQECRPRELSLT